MTHYSHIDILFFLLVMIDVTQWRVSIGLWACHQISCSTHSKEIPNTESSSRIDGVTIIRKIKDLSFSLGVFLLLLLFYQEMLNSILDLKQVTLLLK